MTFRPATSLALLLLLAPLAAAQAQSSDGPRAGTASASANGVRRPARSRPTALEARRRGESVGEQLEACWRAEERGKNRNHDFDQRVGTFHAAVRTRWCLTTLDASGAVDGERRRSAFTRLDSLTIAFETDTLDVRIRERAGQPTLVTVNGRTAEGTWWTADRRRRVLGLARLPLR